MTRKNKKHGDNVRQDKEIRRDVDEDIPLRLLYLFGWYLSGEREDATQRVCLAKNKRQGVYGEEVERTDDYFEHRARAP